MKKLIPALAIVAIAAIAAMFVLSAKTITGQTTRIDFSDAIGKPAPDFTLDSLEGQTKLSDHRGKNVVLFFNEGSMCYPACWSQMAALGNDERFNSAGVVAFSIVIDTKSEWQKIVKQVPQLSKSRILFDSGAKVSSAYDVLSLPSSMHRGMYPGHTYVVIDEEGVIRYVLDDPNMAIQNDNLISEIENLKVA